MSLPLFRVRIAFLTGFGISFCFTLLYFLIGEFAPTTIIHKQKILHVPYGGHEDVLLMFMLSNFQEFNSNSPLYKKGNKNVNSKKILTYQKWLKYQRLKSNKVDMDHYLYSSKNTTKDITIIESEWLQSKIHVTCIIFVEKVKLAESIKATWGNRCTKVYFFGQNMHDERVPVIKFNIKLKSSWQLLCEAMNYVWHAQEVLEWIIFTRDSTVVVPENLRYIVASLDHNEDYYLGYPIIMWKQTYNIAQSGYVLSRSAFSKIIRKFNTSEACAAGGKYWKKEDYYLGKHLSSMDIHPLDTRDTQLRGTFHAHSLHNILWEVTKTGSYWTRALYPPHGEHCSPISVTFNMEESDKMYTLNYLLYHLHVFKERAIFANRPASTPVSETEVWKVALKDEFNMTDVNEISEDKYYAIWRSKYSETRHFGERRDNNRIYIYDSVRINNTHLTMTRNNFSTT